MNYCGMHSRAIATTAAATIAINALGKANADFFAVVVVLALYRLGPVDNPRGEQ